MFVAFAAVVVLLRGVLSPFVAAFVLAYLLDPLANKIGRLRIGRTPEAVETGLHGSK